MRRPQRLALTLSAVMLGGLLPSMALAQAPNGSYQCWFFSSPRDGLNFKLAGTNYTDSEGKAGTVAVTGTAMTFRGAGLDGTRAQYRGGNPPTVSILGPRGDEVSACQLSR